MMGTCFWELFRCVHIGGLAHCLRIAQSNENFNFNLELIIPSLDRNDFIAMIPRLFVPFLTNTSIGCGFGPWTPQMLNGQRVERHGRLA
jgi:hypothetical protein